MTVVGARGEASGIGMGHLRFGAGTARSCSRSSLWFDALCSRTAGGPAHSDIALRMVADSVPDTVGLSP